MRNRQRKIKHITEAYDKAEINERIAPLNISQTGGTVETKWNETNRRTVSVSSRYKMVDFKKMVRDILENIESVFAPEKYRLDIYRARQELRLQGEAVEINGDIYHKVIYLLNSTDKTKAVQMNIGFVREKNQSGVIVNVNSTHKVHYSARHCKGLNLESKIASFMENLEHCDELFDLQQQKLIQLNYAKVRLADVAEALNADEKPIKFDCFKHMLLNSQTDKLTGLSQKEFEALKSPYNVMDKSVLQKEISGYTAFQCYAEIFRSYDSHVVNRETSRMMDIILGKDA
jgi:hypothetical protein